MLVFPSAAAGARLVAAYFVGFAAESGDKCILCIIVHGLRILGGGRLRGGGWGGSGGLCILCIIVHGMHNLLVDL